MRFQSITLLLALGIAGTAACGGGGGADISGNSGPVKNGPYQAPPTIYDSPSSPNPTTYDVPQTDYDPPPDQSEASGTGSSGSIQAVCSRLCREVLALNCVDVDTGGGQVACEQGCSQIEVEIPCPGEFADALSCVLDNINLTCELFSDASENSSIDEEALAQACLGPLEAFASCAGDTVEQEPPPDNGGNCAPGQCDCADDCDQCLCENDNDLNSCDVCLEQL